MIYVQELALLANCDALKTTYLIFKDISFAKGQRTVTKYLLKFVTCAVLTSCFYPGALGQFLPPAQGPFPFLEEGETRPQHRDKLSSSSTVGHRSPKSSRAWLPPSQVSDPRRPLFFVQKLTSFKSFKETVR